MTNQIRTRPLVLTLALAAAALLALPAAAEIKPPSGPNAPDLKEYCRVVHPGSRLFYRGAADAWACLRADGAAWDFIDLARACMMTRDTPKFRQVGHDVTCIPAAKAR
jgi:hypothetical protein